MYGRTFLRCLLITWVYACFLINCRLNNEIIWAQGDCSNQDNIPLTRSICFFTWPDCTVYCTHVAPLFPQGIGNCRSIITHLTHSFDIAAYQIVLLRTCRCDACQPAAKQNLVKQDTLSASFISRTADITRFWFSIVVSLHVMFYFKHLKRFTHFDNV